MLILYMGNHHEYPTGFSGIKKYKVSLKPTTN